MRMRGVLFGVSAFALVVLLVQFVLTSASDHDDERIDALPSNAASEQNVRFEPSRQFECDMPTCKVLSHSPPVLQGAVLYDGVLYCDTEEIEQLGGYPNLLLTGSVYPRPSVPTVRIARKLPACTSGAMLGNRLRRHKRSIFMAVVHYFQAAHFLYNSASVIYGALHKSGIDPVFPDPDMTFYAFIERFKDGDQETWASQEQLQSLHDYILDAMRLFSPEPLRSFTHLNATSRESAVAFDWLMVGGHGSPLDHYNFGNLPAWRVQRFQDFILSGLGLETVPRMRRDHTNVVITRRSRMRKILNAKELGGILSDVGRGRVNVTHAHFEHMSFREQIALMTRTDVLIGMDGSGLFNAVYLPHTSIVVRFFPYLSDKVLPNKGNNFVWAWDRVGVRHVDWYNRREEHTGWVDKPGQGRDEAARLFANGCEAVRDASQGHLYHVFLNQDTLVDPGEFQVLARSVLSHFEDVRAPKEPNALTRPVPSKPPFDEDCGRRRV